MRFFFVGGWVWVLGVVVGFGEGGGGEILDQLLFINLETGKHRMTCVPNHKPHRLFIQIIIQINPQTSRASDVQVIDKPAQTIIITILITLFD